MSILGYVELIEGKHFLEIGFLYGYALSFLAHRHSDRSEWPAWLGRWGSYNKDSDHLK